MNSILEALPPWARRTAGYFAAFQVVLSLLYAVRSHLGDLVATELNMDLEGNFTTWWSSLLLAGVGMAALVLCISKWSDRRARWSWGVMSAGFFFLSMDETSQVHEQLGQRLFGGEGRLWPLLYLPGIVAGAWGDLDEPQSALRRASAARADRRGSALRGHRRGTAEHQRRGAAGRP